MVLTRSKKRELEESEDNTQNKKSRLEEPLSDSTDDDDDTITILDEEEEDEYINKIIRLADPDYEEDGEIVIDYNDLIAILNKTDAKTAENLKKVMETIENKTPKIISILNENIEHEHRVKLIELYEALKEIEQAGLAGHPSRLEYLSLRDHINDLVKKFRSKKKEADKLTESIRKSLKITKDELEKKLPKEDTLETRILKLQTSDENRLAIYNRYRQLENQTGDDSERAKLSTWLEWATRIPHDKIKDTSSIYNDIPKALKSMAEQLNAELYGMEEVKEQILTFINARLQHPSIKGCSLALLGPPGTGKTTIARLLSKVLKTPFAQMSFGGVRDADFLKGFDFCYIGSRPGEITRCLASMSYKNGILFLDEFEKVADNKAITSCLLHIIDPQQNTEFRDSYLREIKMDLSNLWFIYSMNDQPEDTALNDRLYKIKVPGYNKKDKVEILRNYSLRKLLINTGLAPNSVILPGKIAEILVEKISPKTSGMRELEQQLKNIVNKINFLVINSETYQNYPFKISFGIDEKLSFPVTLTEKMIKKFLPEKKDSDILEYMYL